MDVSSNSHTWHCPMLTRSGLPRAIDVLDMSNNSQKLNGLENWKYTAKGIHDKKPMDLHFS